MRYSITFALPDTPGQLLKVLEPIAQVGGNIVSIIHERDRLSEGYVPVSVVVEFPEGFMVDELLGGLKKAGCMVSELKEVFRRSSVAVMVVGDATLVELLELVDPQSVSRVEAEFSSSGRRCLKIELEASEEDVGEALEKLELACDAKGYTLIKPI